MARFGKFFVLSLIGTLLSGVVLGAQVTPLPRVTSQVNESELATLKGNVPMLAQSQFDRGEAATSTQLTHIRLVLSRTPQQQAALDKYLAEVQDKSSSNYHKWLIPEQFGKLYGPADSDVAAIEAWLESHGLKVEGVSSGRTNIAFSGTVSQVEEALHVSIHSFEANGQQFYSNTTNPKIPAALAPVIQGIAHLNTIRPKPLSVRGRSGEINKDTHRVEPMSTRGGLARPNLTVGSGTSTDPYYLYIVPGDAATIYDTPNSFNANFTSGTAYTGQGVNVGIIGMSLIQTSTVSAYRSPFLGSATVPTIVNVDGVTLATNSDAQSESYLDTEISGGLAPGAALYFYTSSDLWGAIDRAVNDNSVNGGTVDILSVSFGYCEQGLSTSDNQELNGWWEQAEAEGIAVTVSTGDTGSAGCDALEDSEGDTMTAAEYGLAVSGYASTPHNVAVGGTDLIGLSFSQNGQNGNVSTSQGSAATYYRTALSYIPESTWNDSTLSDGLLALNEPLTANPDDAQYANIAAGSGGASSCSTNSTVDAGTTYTVGTCTSGYAKPAWQRGTNVPSDGARDIPDVSLMAGNGFDGAVWLVCDDDTTTTSDKQTVTMDCEAQRDGQTYFDGYGGTSTSAPAFAGILALVQQKTGSRLGQAAKQLYDLYNGNHASAIFHDITVGNDSVPCVSGSPNCELNTADYHFESGYDTATGYDLATGLGSVDATQLLTYWGTGIDAVTPTVSVSPSPSNVPYNTGFSVTATVSGSSSAGTPTGTVTLSGGGYTSQAQELVAGQQSDTATYTFNIAAGGMAVGTDTLTLSYSGDANYASASNSTVSVQVSGLTPTLAVNLLTNSLNSSAPLTVPVAVKGSGAAPTPTGTVTLTSGSYSSGPKPLTSGAYQFVVPGYSLAAGTDTLTVAYSGDANYNPATDSSTQVNVTQSTFTLSVSQSPITIAAGATTGNTVSIAVASTTGYIGAVALTAAVTTTPPGAISVPTISVTGSPVTLSAAQTSGSATVVLGTASASAMLKLPPRRGGTNLYQAAGGTIIASLLFFFMPGARRWSKILGVVMLVVAVSLAGVGCSSGNSASSTGGGGSSGATKTTPTVTVTPSQASISVTDPLSVTVAVAGSGSTPTGTVALSGGGYNTSQSLTSGSVTFSIPASTFSAGNVTLMASYGGDSNYNSASGSSTVAVTSVVAPKATPTVTVSPSKTTMFVTDPLSVTVAVAGSGSTPTGSVTLSGGGYTNSGVARTLLNGSVNFSIPASTFTAGNVTLTASYGGDSNYNSATGSTTIAVYSTATTAGTYTVTVTGTGNDPAATKATATFTLIVQ